MTLQEPNWGTNYNNNWLFLYDNLPYYVAQQTGQMKADHTKQLKTLTVITLAVFTIFIKDLSYLLIFQHLEHSQLYRTQKTFVQVKCYHIQKCWIIDFIFKKQKHFSFSCYQKLSTFIFISKESVTKSQKQTHISWYISQYTSWYI